MYSIGDIVCLKLDLTLFKEYAMDGDSGFKDVITEEMMDEIGAHNGVMTVSYASEYGYRFEESNGYNWTDEMIDGLYMSNAIDSDELMEFLG